MPNNVKLHASWQEVVGEEFTKSYFKSLKNFIIEEKQKYIIYPPGASIFAALDTTPFDQVKVVILGQDPYHGQGQANGMSFSVSKPLNPPPSLKNIYKELQDDLQLEIPLHGDLTPWALQGVLLLNSVLTVRANEAASHKNKGWEIFTDTIIKTLSERRSNLVFMLWGAYARNKKQFINCDKHLILESAHPSPFSAYTGFFGCKHFSKANTYLSNHKVLPIDWKL